MNTADKLREYLRGERDWDQRDMARECLEAIDEAYEKGWLKGFNYGATGED